MAGNLSTSSLLNSAAARRNKIQAQEDELVAFEYSLSAKTYGDFVAYSNYLNDRAKKNQSDPSKVLSYQKAIVGARKSYVSNEIQRSNIDIVEGRGDNNTKYQKMVELYYQALDNNDYDLAQNLNLQLDNLSVKIQQEEISRAQSQQRAYGAMAATGAKNLKQLVDKIQKGEELIELPDGRVIKPLGMLDKELRTQGQSNQGGNDAQFFKEAFDSAAALRGILEDTYMSLGAQDEVNDFENKYGSILKGEKSFKIAGRDFDLDELQLAYESAEMNNPIYTLKSAYNQSKGRTEFSIEDNKVGDFAWVRRQDENGNDVYTPIPVRTAADKLTINGRDRDLNVQITNEGKVLQESGVYGIGQVGGQKFKSDDSLTIGNRLRGLGIETKQEKGKLVIQQPGDIEREALITPDGNIRYFGDDGNIYEISPVDRPNFFYGKETFRAGEARAVAPDEVSDFGDTSEFGGMLSQSSVRGKNYVRNFTTPLESVSPVDLREAKISGFAPSLLNSGNTRIGIGNNVTGVGMPATTSLLQGAQFTQNNIQKEKYEALQIQAREEASRILQQATVFNLNQTPTAGTASSGAPIRQLQVKPLPQRTTPITVGNFTQNANLKVGNYTQNARISVGL